MYTAAVLTDISSQLLRWLMTARIDLEQHDFVLQTPQGQSLPHHMTISLGKVEDGLHDHPIIGAEVDLHVTRIAYSLSLGVCAAPVYKAVYWHDVEERGVKLTPFPIHSMNMVPHITICIKPEVQPKDSNTMFEGKNFQYINLDQDYCLKAIVEEIH